MNIKKVAKGKNVRSIFDKKINMNTNFTNNEKNLTIQSNITNDYNNI
jgi:hypothetical protein